MQEKTKLKIVIFFTIFYISVFGVLSYFNNNYEFVFYTLALALILLGGALFLKRIYLSFYIILGLSIGGILHLLSGNLYLSGKRLYDTMLVPHLIRYDNFVHFYVIFFITLAAYSLLKPHIGKNIGQRSFNFYLVLILVAMGVGAIAEIAELLSVIFLGAAEAVGDYMNNAFDLVFNLFGSAVACSVLYIYEKNM